MSRFEAMGLPLAAVALACALLLPPIDATRPVPSYQITFDISQSMNALDATLDGRAVSRLTLAKAGARDLLGSLRCGSRIGWSAFVEQRTMTLTTPLEVCRHYDALRASLDVIDGRMRWGEASNIGKGLHQSLRAASAIGDGTAVIMFSDGHEAPPLRPGVSGLPKDEGLEVSGLLVGVGGDVPVAIPRVDNAGNVVGYWSAEDVVQHTNLPGGGQERSRLYGEHLQSLARLAGLDYSRLESIADLQSALANGGFGRSARVSLDLRWIPALIALIALALRFRPTNRRDR